MLVNGLEARCAARVKPGDLLGFQQRVQPGYTPRGRAPFAVETVFEDDELAVVYKPSGARTTRLLIACIAPPPHALTYGSGAQNGRRIEPIRVATSSQAS